jgi:hypothetical protein
MVGGCRGESSHDLGVVGRGGFGSVYKVGGGRAGRQGRPGRQKGTGRQGGKGGRGVPGFARGGGAGGFWLCVQGG